MMRKFRLPMLVGSAITLLVLVVLFASLALAQGDTKSGGVLGGGQHSASAPIPGGPGYVSMSGIAFKNLSQTDQFLYYGAMLQNPGAATAWYIASVPVPNGAHINRFVIYYLDNDAYDLTATLLRLPLDSGAGEVMANAVSSGAIFENRTMEITSISNPIVDLQQYSYAVQVLLPATLNIGLIGVRVDYDYSSILPLIRK